MIAVVASLPKGVRIGELWQPVVNQVLPGGGAHILGANVRKYRRWRRTDERYSTFLQGVERLMVHSLP